MNSKNILGMTLCLIAAFSSCPDPAWSKGRVNKRQCKQEARINNAAANGQLTNAEACKLQAKQARLAKREKLMRSTGGKLTVKERKKLENSQDNLSKSIYKQAHDEQDKN